MSALSWFGWIGTALCLAGSVVVGQKVKYGFLCQMAGNILWLIVGIGRDMPELIVCSAAFASIYVYNFTLWLRQERRPERLRGPRSHWTDAPLSQIKPSTNGPLRRP